MTLTWQWVILAGLAIGATSALAVLHLVPSDVPVGVASGIVGLFAKSPLSGAKGAS